jgi:hypothetical protein
MHDGAPEAIESRLSAALLTDAELDAGEDAWRLLPDPFGWWHTDPCGTPAVLPAGAIDTEHEEN